MAMSEKQLRIMDKAQLLNIMHQQEIEIERLNVELKKTAYEKDRLTSEHDRLTEENNKLNEEKAGWKSKPAESQFAFKDVESAGSLAEASISVSGILQSAQDAADLYLKNIKRLEEEKIAVAGKLESEAWEKVSAIMKAAEQKREEMEFGAKKAVENLQSIAQMYMDFVEKSHHALHAMIENHDMLELLPKINEPEKNK